MVLNASFISLYFLRWYYLTTTERPKWQLHRQCSKSLSILLQWKGNNTSDVHESSYLLVVTSSSFVLILITKCFRFHLGLLDSFPLVCFSSPPYYKETEVVFFLVYWYWQLQLLFCFLGVCYCFQSGIHVCRDFCPDRVKKNIHNKNLIRESS